MARLKDKIKKYDDKRDKAWCKNWLRYYKEVENHKGCYNEMRQKNGSMEACYKKCVNSRNKHPNESYYQNMNFWDADAGLSLTKGIWFGHNYVLISAFLENHSKGLDRRSKLQPNDITTLKNVSTGILKRDTLEIMRKSSESMCNSYIMMDAILKACDVLSIIDRKKYNKANFAPFKEIIRDMANNKDKYAKLPF